MLKRFIAALTPKLGRRRRTTSSGPRRFTIVLTIAMALPTIVFAADTIILKSGDRLSGTVVERTDATLVLQHSILGRVEIPTEHVAQLITGAIDESGDAAEAQAEEVAQEPLARPQEESEDAGAEDEAPAPPQPEESEWKSHFTFGADLQYGITDEQDVSLSITSIRENDRLKTRLDSAYDFGINNGDRDDNAFYAAILQDWFIPDSKWFYFVHGRFDYDEFDSWEERLAAQGGVGRFLIVKHDFKMSARLGVGGVKEWGSEDEDLRPESLFGLELDWTITDQQSLEARGVYFPWLDDVPEYRTVSDVRWRYRFTDESNMSFSAGLRHEYESTTDPGIDHHDLRIVLGLDFEF